MWDGSPLLRCKDLEINATARLLFLVDTGVQKAIKIAPCPVKFDSTVAKFRELNESETLIIKLVWANENFCLNSFHSAECPDRLEKRIRQQCKPSPLTGKSIESIKYNQGALLLAHQLVINMPHLPLEELRVIEFPCQVR
ncbi:hypothetical protein OFEAOIEE_LOCUS601 [Methylorubrum extorquens]